MKNISAIFIRQLKDTLKNRMILLQFIMFPLITVLMENTVSLEDLTPHFFAEMFSVMYIGMAPMVTVSSIIAEEKEKNTLRVLLMANVKPHEYMLGIGSYVWILCMAGAVAIGMNTGYSGRELGLYLLVMAIGFIISLLIGAVIGLFSKSQMAATSMTVPLMIVLALLPMISMFNRTVEKIAKYFYTYQIRLFITELNDDIINTIGIIVLAVSFLAASAVFFIVYRRNGLE